MFKASDLLNDYGSKVSIFISDVDYIDNSKLKIIDTDKGVTIELNDGEIQALEFFIQKYRSNYNKKLIKERVERIIENNKEIENKKSENESLNIQLNNLINQKNLFNGNESQQDIVKTFDEQINTVSKKIKNNDFYIQDSLKKRKNSLHNSIKYLMESISEKTIEVVVNGNTYKVTSEGSFLAMN